LSALILTNKAKKQSIAYTRNTKDKQKNALAKNKLSPGLVCLLRPQYLLEKW